MTASLLEISSPNSSRCPFSPRAATASLLLLPALSTAALAATLPQSRNLLLAITHISHPFFHTPHTHTETQARARGAAADDDDADSESPLHCVCLHLEKSLQSQLQLCLRLSKKRHATGTETHVPHWLANFQDSGHTEHTKTLGSFWVLVPWPTADIHETVNCACNRWQKT